MVSLESFLRSHEINFSLSSISAVSGISANGRIIIGHGMLGGKTVGFYAEIPEIAGGLLPVKKIDVNTPLHGTVELSWDAPEIPEGWNLPPLVAYRIYEGETSIETVDVSTTAHTFTGVTDGTYLHSVVVVYEQDNKQKEAIVGKTVAVSMSWKGMVLYIKYTKPSLAKYNRSFLKARLIRCLSQQLFLSILIVCVFPIIRLFD
jgi:hypothetical protein